MLFYSHYLYTYAHRRANLTSHPHLHLKRNFHVIYIHLRGNSTSYIHLGSILVPFLTWVHFLKGSLYYLSTNIHILKGIFTIHSHFARYFYAIYIHIYTYRWKVFSMLPKCKVFLTGQPNLNSNKTSQTCPNIHASLHSKPKFGFLAISMFPCIEALKSSGF